MSWCSLLRDGIGSRLSDVTGVSRVTMFGFVCEGLGCLRVCVCTGNHQIGTREFELVLQPCDRDVKGKCQVEPMELVAGNTPLEQFVWRCRCSF